MFPRENAEWLLAGSIKTAEPDSESRLSHAAREVLAALKGRGASFFKDLVRATRRLRSEVEDGLWELVTAGLVTADGFENLRALIDPKRRRGEGRGRNARPRHAPGRWALLQEALQLDNVGLGDAEPGLRFERPAEGTQAGPSSAGGSGSSQSHAASSAEPQSAVGGSTAQNGRDTAATSRPGNDPIESYARCLLSRWGVLFRDLLRRETLAAPVARFA